MAFVQTVYGVIIMGIITGVLWALFFGLEILIKSVGLDFMKYILPVPVILLFAYFIGAGFQQYKTVYGKVK